jgi:ketosteroid isomerase-like protein
MPPSDVELIRDQYAATNERDFERAMSHYAAEVELVVLDGLGSGVYRGRDAVGAWFGDWFATFDPATRFEITELSQREDGAVLLEADMHAIVRGSGVEVLGAVVWLYRLRDGKIVHVEGGTTPDVRQKMGLE